MYLKLNLIVICAVLLNFSESKHCDDVLKCVFDWVASALTLNSTSKVGTIETDSNWPENDNLLRNLSQFLINNFTNVLRQGSFVKVIDIDTKIHAQTLKINDSFIQDAVKSDEETHKNNDDTSDDAQRLKILKVKENKDFQNFTNDIITTNNSDKITTSTYLDNIDTPNINKKTSAENKMNKNVILLKLDITETNNTYETNSTTSQNFTRVTMNIKEDDKTTTAAYFDKEKNSEQRNKDDHVIKNQSTQGNEIDGAYDFGHSEFDIGDLLHGNLTDYLDVDYIELYKDTTNEDVGYTPATYIPTTTDAVEIIKNKKPDNGIDSVYPWIATVFVMNSDNKQFEYICDGILVSERVVLTAARCVIRSNVTVDITNILVILGKRTLQGRGSNEKVLRVQSIKIHENFTSANGKVDNDLAVIVLAERAVFNADIQPAPLQKENKSEPLELATTGWHRSGPLVPLYLKRQTAEFCVEKTGSLNTICSILGNYAVTCSSFGGLLVDRQGENQWLLKGIATGDPVTKGVCFDEDLTFTNIGNYIDWISKNVQESASN